MDTLNDTITKEKFNHKEVVIKIFELCYRTVTNNQGFTLDLQMQKQGVMIDNFLKLLDKKYKLPSIRLNWLIKYFSFQFHYWSSKEANRTLSLAWVIGPKAFQRWLDDDNRERTEYFVGVELEIDFSSIYKEYDDTSLADVIQETSREKRHKLLYFNTELGFKHCIENTTLYTKSKTCVLCKFKDNCKILLKNNYPELYKLRIDG